MTEIAAVSFTRSQAKQKHKLVMDGTIEKGVCVNGKKSSMLQNKICF